MLPLLLATVLFLAYTNGANDNFKGVATLFGSRTTDYRRALIWATITTFAGAVSFARGLNDTPKIVALLVAGQALSSNIQDSLCLVAVAMALGGIFSARRVAHTMSQRITAMNHGQGFTANLVTSALVTLASRFGWPVSTTHVSVGALFGIGLVSDKVQGNVVRNIVLSWVITLPVAACLAAVIYWLA